MGKGKGGKGKQSTNWDRKIGTFPYLKNFRKGLRFQLERCEREWEAARDDATARAATTERWRWILEKQHRLDNLHEMVRDMPVTEHGVQMKTYGSLGPDARRPLTDDEIRWNAELIEAEGLQQRRGGSTAASAEHS